MPYIQSRPSSTWPLESRQTLAQAITSQGIS